MKSECNVQGKFDVGYLILNDVSRYSFDNSPLCDAYCCFNNGFTLIPALISSYIHYKVWDKITNPFINFNGFTVEI